MRLLTNIDLSRLQPAEAALVFQGFIEGVIRYNRALIRAGVLPPLYKSGVRYRPEPWRGGIEEVADAWTVLRRGWGDCDDLSPWRTAELQEAGDAKAHTKVSWKPRRRPDGSPVMVRGRPVFVWHVTTRRGDGRVEDPSRYLGM